MNKVLSPEQTLLKSVPDPLPEPSLVLDVPEQVRESCDASTATCSSAEEHVHSDSAHSNFSGSQTGLDATTTAEVLPGKSRALAISNMAEKIQFRGPSNNLYVSVIALLTGIALWHWATAVNLDVYINFENVPSPATVFSAFVAHLQTDVFYVHIGVSMRRILISYCLAVVVGVFIGLWMGRSTIVRAVVMPYIEIIRPIPAVAWIPLAILMWPTEEASIIYITYLGALFPIVINTMHGVEQTPEVLVRAARSLGASSFNIFWHIVLPAALPSISAGLAIGMGVSWFSLLAGEIISGQYGIGYFTWNAYSLINYQDIVVGMLVIGFLGTLSTIVVKSLTKPFLRWQEKTR